MFLTVRVVFCYKQLRSFNKDVIICEDAVELSAGLTSTRVPSRRINQIWFQLNLKLDLSSGLITFGSQMCDLFNQMREA